jgi:hypothetical protein
MRFPHHELRRSNFDWPQVRLPRIRFAVPSIVDGVRRKPEKNRPHCNAHRELLDEFRRDMDGFMPLPVSRRNAKKR